MSRVIKFRCWDENKKRMQYGDEFLLRLNGDVIFGSVSPMGDQFCRDQVIEQFTGLKDKAGREIYEGDIVKCSSGCQHEVKWFPDNGGTYGGGMPGFNLDGLHRNCGKGYAWGADEELIGNVHENPELLKNAEKK